MFPVNRQRLERLRTGKAWVGYTVIAATSAWKIAGHVSTFVFLLERVRPVTAFIVSHLDTFLIVGSVGYLVFIVLQPEKPEPPPAAPRVDVEWARKTYEEIMHNEFDPYWIIFHWDHRNRVELMRKVESILLGESKKHDQTDPPQTS
jgi:hypothetical protein